MRKKSKIKSVPVEKVEAILKIKKIFSMGYLPAREYQTYSEINPHTGNSFSSQINCFAHACLNLTNEQLANLNLDNDDTYYFDIKDYSYEPEEYIEKCFLQRIKRFGLTAETCDKTFNPQKENQWKVALYFGTTKFLDCDYHFLKQEKDGSWSCKIGWSPLEVDRVETLPKVYKSPVGTDYYFYKTYIITNPEANKVYDEDYVEIYHLL